MDAGTGEVMTIVLPQTLTMSVKLTPDQALAAAEAYLDAHKVSFDGLTSSVTLEDSGSTKYFSVTFQRYREWGDDAGYQNAVRRSRHGRGLQLREQAAPLRTGAEPGDRPPGCHR